MTFHIGQQNAGVANNVAGDQTIHGGQHGTVVSAEVQRALADLRTALDAAPLAPDTAKAARNELDEASQALDQPEPDTRRAAGALERLTRLLGSAGSLASAAAAFVGPLQTLGRWLGPMGASLLALLPVV